MFVSILAAVILPLIAAFGYELYAWIISKPLVPQNAMPWVGRYDGLFGKWKSRLHALSHTTDAVYEGWNKFNSKGTYFARYNLFGHEEVLMPSSELDWFLAQEPKKLDAVPILGELLQRKYTGLNGTHQHNPAYISMVRRALSKRTRILMPEIADEIALFLNKHWGTDPKVWKEVPLFADLRNLFSRTISRVFIGPDLSHNEEFLHASQHYTSELLRAGPLLRMTPVLLRPVAAILLTRKLRDCTATATRVISPTIQKRAENVRRLKLDPDFKYTAPHDLITWSVEDSLRQDIDTTIDPGFICSQILFFNFIAINTSAIGAMDTILDLLASPPESGFLTSLQEEAERVFIATQGQCTSDGLGKMIRIDSAIKESLRLHGPSTGMPREVVWDDGLQLPDGTMLQKGARVSINSYGEHRNAVRFLDPLKYDAQRYSRLVEEYSRCQAAGEHLSDKELRKMQDATMTSTGEGFLSFGHGKHACPGRFFFLDEMKLLLGYIMLNYDFERLETRPEGKVYADFQSPSKESIRVRWKESSIWNQPRF